MARAPEVRKYLALCRREIKRALSSYSAQMSAYINTRPIESWESIILHKEEFQKAYTKIYTTVSPEFAAKTSKLKEGEPYWVTYFRRYTQKNLAKRITLVTNTTEKEFKRITRNVVAQGQLEGWGYEQTGREIRKQIGFSNVYRGERIARTELLSSANVGSIEGARSSNVPMEKQWNTALDERTRESHAALNGQRISMDAVFSNGLDYPGDVNGEAEEVINCRCFLTYHVI
jgi:hypothetical protein